MRIVPRARLTRRTLAAAAATCLLTALACFLLAHAMSGLRAASGSSERSSRVIAQSSRTEQAFDTLDAGQRGYLSRHGSGLPAPWTEARLALPGRLQELERLVVDNPAQERRARSLSAQIGAYTATWSAPLVELARRNPARARRLAATNGGAQPLARIRNSFATFDRVEQRLGRQRDHAAGAAAAHAVWIGFAGLLAVLGLVLAFALYVVRTVVRPVREVALAAARVGEGDLSVRVPAAGNDEVGDLGRAFNAMSIALERDRDAVRDLTARLEQSNRDLEDFASVTSHDLQEPLRKIQTFADRLTRKHAHELSEGGLDYLDRMQRSAGRMQELISDLLTLSRVSSAAKPFAPVDLGEIGDEVVSDLEASIESADATVELGPLPTVDADRVQMRQLLQNLISNAIKFRRPDLPPHVRVSTGSNGDGCCRLVVEDNGIGFDQKYAEQIFAVFERLHARSDYDGCGVGLAVCRKIAQRHGGEIAASSTEGAGARFVVTLPLRHLAAD